MRSSNETAAVMEAQPTSNPLDVVPEQVPFDVPYGLPISLGRAEAVIHAAVRSRDLPGPTKVFEDGINLMHLNYLLAFDGVIASPGGILLIEQGAIIGAIGCSGGTDSKHEIVSEAGAAVINRLPASNK